MRDFTFHRPESLEETFELLDRYGEDVRLIAGGTALVIMLKQRLAEYPHLIDIRGVAGLNGIANRADGLHIGATTIHREVETSVDASIGWPVLTETYHHVASVRIRSSATVGGGLAHADPSQDPPPTLIVLGAKLVVASKGQERSLEVEDLYRDYFETTLAPGEVLREVIIPPLPEGSGTAFIKFLPKTADDYVTVSAAANLRMSNGRCEEARVALGCAGPVPIRASNVEEALRGQELSAAVLRDAAELVKDEVDPMDDVRGSAAYKRDMAAVITRRALEQALNRLQR
jgi:carbon-monoxide dehydrogenase medium subunit